MEREIESGEREYKDKTKIVFYWLTTVILVLGIFSGGVAELMKRPETMKGMIKLGYPAYFIAIIGFWKVLGSIALLMPRFPRLKEWAYAGIFFNMTGAALSHVANNAAVWHIIVTLCFAVLTIVSWAIRPKNRTLKVILHKPPERRIVSHEQISLAEIK